MTNPNATKVIKMTSQRSGAVAWFDERGCPTDHRTCAGHFEPEAARAQVEEFVANLIGAIGVCRWNLEILDLSVRS